MKQEVSENNFEKITDELCEACGTAASWMKCETEDKPSMDKFQFAVEKVHKAIRNYRELKSKSLQPNIVGEGNQKVDVEKLAQDKIESMGGDPKNNLLQYYKGGIIWGYNQALQSQVGEGEKMFVKRKISEHGNPKEEKWYDTDEGKLFYSRESEMFHFKGSVFGEVKMPSWYYQEITLPIQPLQKGKSIEDIRILLVDAFSEGSGISDLSSIEWCDKRDKWIQEKLNSFSQPPLQNGMVYTEEQMKQMAIQISDWKDGYTGKSDNRDLHTVVNDFLSSLTHASTENEAVDWISVKDRLPTDSKTYTCYGEDWCGYPIFSAIHDEDGWYIMNGEKRMRQFPTHWKENDSAPSSNPHINL